MLKSNLVAIYCRVSSDEQADRGTIENQKIFADKYIDLHQLHVYDYYMDEGITGTLPLQKRPEGKRLLDDAKAGKFNLVLFFKLDRLGRSVRVILNAVYDLQELKVDVRSMTEAFDTTSPAGRFALTTFAGIAELDRDTILTRMRQGTLRNAELGKWLGGPVPYGYTLEEGYLQLSDSPIPGFEQSEVDIVKIIFDKIVNEKCSADAVADYLNQLGIPTKYKILNRKIVTSGYWFPSRILRIVHNTVYYGVHVFGDKSKHKDVVKIEQRCPAIVSRELWDAAQQQLKSNMICSVKNKKYNYLLRGLIKCGSCGSSYICTSYKGSKERKTRYYICNGKLRYQPIKDAPKCRAQNLCCDWIDSIVWQDCLEYIQQPEKILLTRSDSFMPDIEQEMEALNKTKDKLVHERSAVLDLFRRSIITEADLTDQLEKISMEQQKLQATMDEKKTYLVKAEKFKAEKQDMVELLKSFQRYLRDDISFDDKQKIVQALVDNIIVDTDYNNGRRDIPLVKVTINYVFNMDKSPIKHDYNLDCSANAHGLAAATKMILLGKVILPRTREILTSPSSNGWRSISKVALSNSGSSSKNKTPL